MAMLCYSNEYYDLLLQSCKSCHLRCAKTPPPPCRSYCTTSADSPVMLPVKDNGWILWFILAFFLVLIPTIFFLTIMLRRQLKSILEHEVNEQTDSSVERSLGGQNTAQLESVTTGKGPLTWHCGDTVDHLQKESDMALSDYLFPLPAVEEGAAILVTTKTSAGCERGPDVGGDAFVEM